MTTYFVADLHFGDDAYTMKGARPGGSPSRPFADAAAMDAALIARWNEVVSDGDVVWVLGDVAKRGHLKKVGLLKGEKRLVAGNRDPIGEIVASGLFAEVHAVKYLPGMLLTHVPVHPSQLGRAVVNVHGHLHGRAVGDDRFICVSVDQTAFRPICHPCG